MTKSIQPYVALLRGINVGGKNKLPMAALVKLLSGYDIENMRTYLQTGNITFYALNTSESIKESKWVTSIEECFGFKAEVIILTKTEFELAVKSNPYQEKLGKTCHFYFCKEIPKLDVTRLEKLKATSESYQLQGKIFYLHAPDGIGKSKLAKSTEDCLGVKATARNLNTVNKIVSMLS